MSKVIRLHHGLSLSADVVVAINALDAAVVKAVRRVQEYRATPWPDCFHPARTR